MLYPFTTKSRLLTALRDRSFENIVGKGENANNENFSSFPSVLNSLHIKFQALTLYKRQILDSSKLKMFADDSFNFDENGGEFFKWLENTVGKGEIAHYEKFLLFPQCFQKTCTAGKGLFGKGLTDNCCLQML